MITVKQASIKIVSSGMAVMLYLEGQPVTSKKIQPSEMGATVPQVEAWLNNQKDTFGSGDWTIEFYRSNGSSWLKAGGSESLSFETPQATAPASAAPAYPSLLGVENGREKIFVGEKDFLIDHYRRENQKQEAEIERLQIEVNNLTREKNTLQQYKDTEDQRKTLDGIISEKQKKSLVAELNDLLKDNPDIKAAIGGWVAKKGNSNAPEGATFPGLESLPDDYRAIMGQWIQALKDKMDANDRDWIAMATIVMDKCWKDAEFLNYLFQIATQPTNPQPTNTNV